VALGYGIAWRSLAHHHRRRPPQGRRRRVWVGKGFDKLAEPLMDLVLRSNPSPTLARQNGSRGKRTLLQRRNRAAGGGLTGTNGRVGWKVGLICDSLTRVKLDVRIIFTLPIHSPYGLHPFPAPAPPVLHPPFLGPHAANRAAPLSRPWDRAPQSGGWCLKPMQASATKRECVEVIG